MALALGYAGLSCVPQSLSDRELVSMGNKIVTFTDQQLEDYQDCTFFTRKEILRVHQRFHEASPDLVPMVMNEGQASTIQVPRDRIERLPELVENPFKGRMCEAFSRDGDGNLTFDDFLDLLSVFSEHAPRDIKVYYAFKIYDYDRDGFIGQSDLLQVITALTRNELIVEEHQQIVEKVIEEADVDGDGKLSYLEFEHVITRAPDFISTRNLRTYNLFKDLRQLVADGATDEEITEKIRKQMNEIYNVVGISLGIPPEKFTWECYDKSKKYLTIRPIQPIDVYVNRRRSSQLEPIRTVVHRRDKRYTGQ
uniref:Putative ca2+-binding kinase n=1 Tax=Anopheles darlingi TaxID=43151 RepID=A0A2M4CMC5_ANODA